MSGFFLDTNVLSEFARPDNNPDQRVKQWLEAADPDSLYASVLTFGEIRRGIEKLPPSKRRTHLETWLAKDLHEWFENRLLVIDEAIANRWGILATAAQRIKLGRVCVILLLFGLSFSQIEATQNTSPSSAGTKDAGQDLKLVVIGEMIMSTGRHGAFRTYETSDGVRATASYATFDSLNDAKRQTRLWLKSAEKIIKKEEKKDQSGQVIRERAVALAKKSKSHKKVFLIIMRDGSNCYLIDSLSLPVGLQVEKLID
jgi:predicted nucleic acid-binding protein